MVTDKGIDLTDSTETLINARGNCTVDIAEAPYMWYVDTTLIGTADATGKLVFPSKSVKSDSIALRTTLPGVTIRVRQVCKTAVITGLFERFAEQIQLKIYPTIVGEAAEIQVEIPEHLHQAKIRFEITSINGQRMLSIDTEAGILRNLSTQGLEGGMYIVQTLVEGNFLIGKFVVMR
jgi:hypothetical protein